MTRAKERLYLSYAFLRHWYGNTEPSLPSRFLADLPPEVLGQPSKPKRSVQGANHWSAPRWGQALQRQPERRPAVQQRFHRGQHVSHRRFGEGAVQDSQILAGLAPLEPFSKH
jgi:DNA helicase-2/ATP-dependent DNA helicase PcrA